MKKQRQIMIKQPRGNQMVHKKGTLGRNWEDCTETKCKNKHSMWQCCSAQLFGGSQFADDTCLKRLNNDKATGGK